MKKKQIRFSATSKKDLEKLVNRYFWSNGYYLDESDMKIKNKLTGKVLDYYSVEIKNGRYRVYREVEL